MTLQQEISNRIVALEADRIVRCSDRGRTDESWISEVEIRTVWDILCRDGRTPTPEGVHYFTPALMLAALPDLIMYEGEGWIALKR